MKKIALIGAVTVVILLAVLSVVLLFTRYYYYSIGIFIFVLILYLVMCIVFFQFTKKMLIKQRKKLVDYKIKNHITIIGEIKYIVFEKVSDKWRCKNDMDVVFDLHEYLFQKSFLRALIVRKLRYPTVSNKKPLIKFLSFNLEISEFDNLYIRYIINNKIKDYKIVINNISKNSILSRAISKSVYFCNFLDNRVFQKMKKIEPLNELIYLNNIKYKNQTH